MINNSQEYWDNKFLKENRDLIKSTDPIQPKGDLGFIDIHGIQHIFPLQQVPQGGKIIDLGCGIGGFSKQLKLLRPECDIYGVDFSEVAIKLNKDKISNINFLHQDIEKGILFPDNFFDAVFIRHVLEYIDYPDKFIKEAIRVLKPGGLAYIVTMFLASRNPEYNNYFTTDNLPMLFSDYSNQMDIFHAIQGIQSQTKCWNVTIFMVKNKEFYSESIYSYL